MPRIVVAALIRRNGQYLLHQRPQGAWGEGLWEFPGGKLEDDEDPRDALVRECREELGVAVRVNEIYDVTLYKYPDLDPVLLLFYRAELLEGEPRALLGGNIEWATPAEMPSYDWLPADCPLIEKIAREES